MKRIIFPLIISLILLLSSCNANVNNANEYSLSDFTENQIKISDIYTDKPFDGFQKVAMPNFPQIENTAVSEDNFPKQTPETQFVKYPDAQVADYVMNDDIIYFAVNYDIYYDYSHAMHIFSYNIKNQELKNIYKLKLPVQAMEIFYQNNQLYISANVLEDEANYSSVWRFSTLELNGMTETTLYQVDDVYNAAPSGIKQVGDIFEWTEALENSSEDRKFVLKYYDTEDKQVKTADESAYYYGEYGDFSKDEYSKAVLNETGKIDFIREANGVKTTIKTTYDFAEFLSADDEYIKWVNWPAKKI